MTNPDFVVMIQVKFVVAGQSCFVVKSAVGTWFAAFADASVVGQNAVQVMVLFGNFDQAVLTADVAIAGNTDVGLPAKDIFPCPELVFSVFSGMEKSWIADFWFFSKFRYNGFIGLNSRFSQRGWYLENKNLLAGRAFQHSLFLILWKFIFGNADDFLALRAL